MESPGEARAWRIRTSLRARIRAAAPDLWLGATLGGMSLLLLAVVLVLVPHDLAAGGHLPALLLWAIEIVDLAAVTASGAITVAALRDARRRLLLREDIVTADAVALTWERRAPGPPAGCHRLAWEDVEDVRLADGDARVVVRARHGVEHTLTDLGTPADRAGLATALRDVVWPGAPRVRPGSPPLLPRGWHARPEPGEPAGVLMWRRPRAWRTTGAGVAAWLSFVGVVLVAASGPAVLQLLLLVPAACTGWGMAEALRRTNGWVLRPGRLERVRLRARSGTRRGRYREPVTGLELIRPRRPGGRCRVDAVLGGGRRVALGRPPRPAGEEFAAWLADRADLPLTRPARPARPGATGPPEPSTGPPEPSAGPAAAAR